MKHIPIRYLIAGLILLKSLPCSADARMRERIELDRGWQFRMGELERAQLEQAEGWENVWIPHDWSIQLATDAAAPAAGGGGYFPTGTGWYRLEFAGESHWLGQRVELEFEGFYRNAAVYLNGKDLGIHESGYTPVHLDITRFLKLNASNLLEIRVDNEPQPHSRWYTGSGIYRPVWLNITHPIHIPAYGVEISTWDLYPEAATVWMQIELANTTPEAVNAEIDITIADDRGIPIVQDRFGVSVAAGARPVSSLKVGLADPRLWTPESPQLYRAITRVFVDGLMTDRMDNTFGIRDVRVSANRGFELNRTPQVLLFGGNVHHDTGVLGAAAFARAEERKVRLLKEAGFNAVRTAHNLPSRAFLEACDRLGLMVVNEIFDGWARAKLPHDFSSRFEQRWQQDIDWMIRRDRNHPSIVMWSIGNEMYERASPRAVEMAAAMVARIRSHITAHPNNPIRLATAGINGLGEQGDWTRLDPLFATLDVSGYNYEMQRHADDHQRVPRRVIYGAESYQADAYAAWAAAHDHSHVIGDFVWSAIDYLGESGIGRVFAPDAEPYPHWVGSHYPWHGASCGDIDLTGYRKPVSHYRAIVWDRGQKLYAAVENPAPDGGQWNLSQWAVPPMRADWTWPGHERKPLQVEVFSRYPSVRLYLNGRRVGEQPTTRQQQFKATFSVPYRPGTLEAVAMLNGKEVERFTLQTAGKAAALSMKAEQSRIHARGNDIAFVVVEVVDDQQRRIYNSDTSVSYSVTGPGEIIAVGSADLSSKEGYTATTRKVFEGRAIVVIRSLPQPGTVRLHATAQGLQPAVTEIAVGY